MDFGGDLLQELCSICEAKGLSEESVDRTDASQLFCNNCFAASVLWRPQSRVVAMTIAPTIAAAQMAPSKIYFRLFELG